MSKRISIDDNFIVETKSNFDGTLVFCEGGYDERWYGVGDTVEMPWEELKDIRKYKRSFFENNWIILESNEEYTAAQMYEALGVSQYYPVDESLKSVDDVLSMKPNEIAKFLKDKNEGYKETLYTYAKRLVEEGDKRLDSTAKRTAIEKAVGMSFDEV
jgi:hypothetical protein